MKIAPPYILYDGECPFCKRYVTMLRLRDTLPDIKLLNAREHIELVEYYYSRGLNVDDGMIMGMGRHVFFGHEVLHCVARMTTSNSWANRLNAFIFRSALLSRMLYPVMRCGRNMTIRLLGRSKLMP